MHLVGDVDGRVVVLVTTLDGLLGREQGKKLEHFSFCTRTHTHTHTAGHDAVSRGPHTRLSCDAEPRRRHARTLPWPNRPPPVQLSSAQQQPKATLSSAAASSAAAQSTIGLLLQTTKLTLRWRSGMSFTGHTASQQPQGCTRPAGPQAHPTPSHQPARHTRPPLAASRHSDSALCGVRLRSWAAPGARRVSARRPHSACDLAHRMNATYAPAHRRPRPPRALTAVHCRPNTAHLGRMEGLFRIQTF